MEKRSKGIRERPQTFFRNPWSTLILNTEVSCLGGGILERIYIQSGLTMVVGLVKSKRYATFARDLIIGGHRPKPHKRIISD